MGLPIHGARLVVIPNSGAMITLALDGCEAATVLSHDDDTANVVEVGRDFFLVRGPHDIVARCERIASDMCENLASLKGRIVHVIAAGEGITSFFGAEVRPC